VNSDELMTRVAPYQSVGQFGARDFNRYVFQVPFPLFDPRNELHQSLEREAARAEEIATRMSFPSGINFKGARAKVRAELEESGAWRAI
jgi:hypothetical protein